ncbi:unnamed protein product, partial [marine sediment metagenome]
VWTVEEKWRTSLDYHRVAGGSVSGLQYARQAIQKRLILDEMRFEEQKMEEAEIKERLKD